MGKGNFEKVKLSKVVNKSYPLKNDICGADTFFN